MLKPRFWIVAFLTLLPVVLLGDDKPAAGGSSVACTVTNQSEDPMAFSAAALEKLPHVELRVKDRVFSGVPLAELLRAAGVIWEGKCSPLLTCYVSVEGADGYRVLFSITEIDPGQRHKMVILADRCNGKPLSKANGPYETIEEDATQRGRWVRHTDKIALVRALPRSRPRIGTTGEKSRTPGKMYLVGMGPGDAELVTLKAVRVLKEADCVICFDYLKAEVERYVPTEKVTVASPLLMGRSHGQDLKTLSPQLQERARRNEAEMAKFVPHIRALIAEGKTVAFADAGDPTLYCPWTWIADEFADLDPTVVPGLSSFNAANAALKQSMTKNGGSILLTPGDDLGSPDAHGRLTTMLVLFTHKAKFKELLPKLQSRYPADTPIAIVCEASYERQRVLFGTLATIREKADAGRLPHLYLIYVGDGLTPPK